MVTAVATDAAKNRENKYSTPHCLAAADATFTATDAAATPAADDDAADATPAANDDHDADDNFDYHDISETKYSTPHCLGATDAATPPATNHEKY